MGTKAGDVEEKKRYTIPTFVYDPYHINLWIGDYLDKRKKFYSAINQYNAGESNANVDREMVPIYEGRSKAYLHTWNLKATERDIKEGMQLDPGNTNLMLTLGNFYYQKNRFEDALGVYYRGHLKKPRPPNFIHGIWASSGTILNSLGSKAGNIMSRKRLGDMVVKMKLKELGHVSMSEEHGHNEITRRRKIKKVNRIKDAYKQIYLNRAAVDSDLLRSCLDDKSLFFGNEKRNKVIRKILEDAVEKLHSAETSLWRRKPLYTREQDMLSKRVKLFNANKQDNKKADLKIVVNLRIASIDRAFQEDNHSECFKIADELRNFLFLQSERDLPSKNDVMVTVISILGELFLKYKTLFPTTAAENDERLLVLFGFQKPQNLTQELFSEKGFHPKISKLSPFLDSKLADLKHTTNPLERAYLCHEIGVAYSFKGFPFVTKKYARKAIFAAKTAKDRKWHLNSMFLLARAEIQQRNMNQGRISLNGLMSAAEKFNYPNIKYLAIRTNQRTLFTFFSKTSEVQDAIKEPSSLKTKSVKDSVKELCTERNDIFNGLDKFKENKPNIKSIKEPVLFSTENNSSTGRKTSEAIVDSKISPKKVTKNNISSFLSPTKNTNLLKLASKNSNDVTECGSINAVPSKARNNISLKRSPKKRKFLESPLKNTGLLTVYSSPEKVETRVKNQIQASEICSTEPNNLTDEKKDETDSVNLAEDSIIISPEKIKVKRRKCLLEESSLKRILNFKDLTNDEMSNKLFADEDDLSSFFKVSLFDEENKNFDLKELQRCQVISINADHNGEKQITLKNIAKNNTGVCILRSPWDDCPIFPEDIISVKGVRSPEGWVVDWKGLLVTNPDKLISGTTIVGSVYCMRKTILSHIFKEVGEGTRYPMVLGSSVHQLFQEALKQKYFSIEEIEKEYKRMIDSKDFMLTMFLEKMDYAEITNKLKSFIEHIHKFMETYIAGYSNSKNGNNWSGEIVETQDIEENIYSPILGVKGKVDATVRVQVGNRVKTMPLELKTGKVSFSIEHRGQVILYCMLLKQMGYLVDSGLLLYLSSGVEMKEIKCEEKEVRDLTLLRNGLCHWLIKSTSIEVIDNLTFPPLPPPINRKSCSSCPYLVPCYAALREKNLSEVKEGNLLSEFGSVATKHLSDDHIKFVFHWLSLIFLEKGSSKSSLSDIWTVDSEIREKTGKCLAQMKVDSCLKADGVQYIATFSKVDNSLLETELTPGQLTVIGSENRIAQALGKVQEVSPMTISVMLDKNLKSDEVMTIDLYDSDGTYTILMNNLTILMENTDRSAALRDLIIDLKIPRFSAKLSSKIKRIGEDIFARLNKEQIRAVLQAISAENYILIKGMPGAGKTTTMAALIELLTRLGMKVLVTSFTHSAVDNILINLVGKVKMLRLGPDHRVHPKLKEFTENYYLQSLKQINTANIEKIFTDKNVVGVTCFGCKHLWVERQVFDVCLVDEAAQVSLPAILKPISLAKKFILVGDPKQLPALVLNEKAKELGLGISLFERLDRPAVTSPLTIQYRMNRVINELANNLTYDGQLKCSNKETEESTLSLPKDIPSSAPDWLQHALLTDINRSVVILDVENKNKSDSTENHDESKVVVQIVEALIQAGVESESIGIIAPYNRQVLLLRSSIEKSIEVNTVDQYQGRDKDIIIFSTTRSNYSTGRDILGDWNRMNVAVTRAKRKLIILGNLDILCKYENFAKLLSFVEKNNIFKVV